MTSTIPENYSDEQVLDHLHSMTDQERADYIAGLPESDRTRVAGLTAREQEDAGQDDLLFVDGSLLEGEYDFMVDDNGWLNLWRGGRFVVAAPPRHGATAGDYGTVHVDAGEPGGLQVTGNSAQAADEFAQEVDDLVAEGDARDRADSTSSSDDEPDTWYATDTDADDDRKDASAGTAHAGSDADADTDDDTDSSSLTDSTSDAAADQSLEDFDPAAATSGAAAPAAAAAPPQWVPDWIAADRVNRTALAGIIARGATDDARTTTFTQVRGGYLLGDNHDPQLQATSTGVGGTVRFRRNRLSANEFVLGQVVGAVDRGNLENFVRLLLNGMDAYDYGDEARVRVR